MRTIRLDHRNRVDLSDVLRGHSPRHYSIWSFPDGSIRMVPLPRERIVGIRTRRNAVCDGTTLTGGGRHE